jgi:hypothetical protein
VVNNNYKSVPEHIFHPKVKQIPLVSHDTPNMELTRVHYNKKNKKFCLNFFFFFKNRVARGGRGLPQRWLPPTLFYFFIYYFFLKKTNIFILFIYIFIRFYIFLL